ncbi:MAG: hypothetical protein P8O03_15115 [Ilumatobacter sp.]|nr:hypothetical protein [bacterium]MDG1267644.1 hypothetical protein [Ilumatobacter sp.]
MSHSRDPRVLSCAVLVGAIFAATVILVLGMTWPVALLVGIAGFFVSRWVGMKKSAPPPIDPFSVGEPWRQFIQGAQRAGQRLHVSVASAGDGPLKDRMSTIVDRLDDGLAETWTIARRGDQIDDTVRRLDPTSLRSKQASLEKRLATAPNDDVESALASLRSQIDATERLKADSAKLSNRLRLTQTRLDELVTRAAEVAIGAGDTDAYEHDVDDLVIDLEALRQAIEETNLL